MNIRDIISINPDVQFGTPVFAGTRVPVVSLFMHLERGITVDDFLIDFPSVKKDQCYAAIEIAAKLFNSKDIFSIYENAA